MVTTDEERAATGLNRNQVIQKCRLRVPCTWEKVLDLYFLYSIRSLIFSQRWDSITLP